MFVSYLPSIIENWTDERKMLDVNDLKILSFLLQKGSVSKTQLLSLLKMSEKQILISFDKLFDANLIMYKQKLWKPKDLKSIFSIKNIVSVEAKIGETSRVMEQSLINTWFASHSYALMNVAKPQDKTVRAFSQRGLGLYCKGENFNKIIDAKPLSLPSSYQSLLFNEWIGNRIVM